MRALGSARPRFDIAQALAWVEALTGSQDTIMVLQFADDTAAKRKDLSRVHVGSIHQLADIIEKLNAARIAVWAQVNSGRRGKRNVPSVRAVFIDDDGKGLLPPLLRQPPSITVASSDHVRNRHHYWLLADGQSIERWPQLQKHLALFYGTDKSMTNLDRVMRLPGTWNMHGPCVELGCAKCAKRLRSVAEPVTLLNVAPGRRYTYEEIIAAHPLDTERQADSLTVGVASEAPTEAALTMAKRIAYWLTTKEIAFDRVDAATFRLLKCPFNPTHQNKMMIKVQSRGGIWAGCWHDSCGGNTNRWAAVKDRIGGWVSDAAPFTRGDEVELAQRMLVDVTASSEEALVSDLGGLWKYNPASGLWTEIEESTMAQTISAYAGQRVGKKLLRMGRSNIRGAIGIATDLVAQPHFFGEAPPGIAFRNGVLMATPNGAAFVPHDAENRLILGLPFDYVEGADCKRWRSYLAECFAEDDDATAKIDLLQEFLGACLIGIAPRFQKALVLYGTGENGKSVYSWVAGKLFPDSVRRAIKPQDWGKEYYVAMMATARINIVGEMPETDIVSGDAFKAVVTGDPIEGRHPSGRPFEVAMQAGHIFNCNRLPGTADHTWGFWRRFIIVEWLRVFPQGHPMRDNTLKERIVATEMPGVAAWAVAGASRLLARDALTVPASHDRILAGWQRDTDAVAAFIKECCEPYVEGAGVPIRELYPFFKLWAVQGGRRAIADSTFGRRLKENRIQHYEREGHTYYCLRLIPEAASRLGSGIYGLL